MTAHAAHERDFANTVVQRLRDMGHTALFAGGCVRDLLMQRNPSDFDVATDATPDAVRQLFGHKRTLAVGASFGVVIVLGPKHEGKLTQVEVATFRTEGDYHDGRRPSHVVYCTAKEDAQRRDFTINGMFYDPVEERVIDYVDGEKDLHEGLIRAIGDPRDRMTEDKLRMLRAMRFAAVLDFEIEADTSDAVTAMASQLNVVSWERIAQELRKMLVHPHRRRAIRLCQQHELLALIVPELAEYLEDTHDHELTATLNHLDALNEPTFCTALATLLHNVPVGDLGFRKHVPDIGVVRSVCRRLRLSNDECDRVEWLVDRQHALSDAPNLSLAELKQLLAHPGCEELLVMMQAQLSATAANFDSFDFVQTYLAEHSPEQIAPPPLLTGSDLQDLGYRPGPRFKELLELVRIAQLNEEIFTREAAIEMLCR